MEHLQAKEESAQGGAESAPDPEDLAAQVCEVSVSTYSRHGDSSKAGRLGVK